MSSNTNTFRNIKKITPEIKKFPAATQVNNFTSFFYYFSTQDPLITQAQSKLWRQLNKSHEITRHQCKLSL